MDKIISIDKRSVSDIQGVIDFCQGHTFWSMNALCPESIRKHFDRIDVEMAGSQENNYIKINKALAYEAKNEHPEALKDLIIKSDYIAYKGKDLALKMLPKVFEEHFLHIIGATYNA